MIHTVEIIRSSREIQKDIISKQEKIIQIQSDLLSTYESAIKEKDLFIEKLLKIIDKKIN